MVFTLHVPGINPGPLNKISYEIVIDGYGKLPGFRFTVTSL
jgi:hypothetical protein